MTVPVCQLLVTGAPLAQRSADVAATLVDDGWIVQVVSSTAAVPWLDLPRLRETTGYPVRLNLRQSGPRPPAPSAIVVCPLTANTLAKAAVGIADTPVTGVLCEGLGLGIPIVAVPMAKDSLWRHPAFRSHLDVLGRVGVHFLNPADGTTAIGPTASGTGERISELFDPRWVCNALRSHAAAIRH